jgi:hypothetical protein
MARESSNHDTPNLLHDASISTRIGLIPPHPLLPRGVVGDLGAASCSGCCCVKIFLVFVLCCCFLRFFSGAGQRGGKGFRSKLFDVRGHKRTNTCAQQIVHDKLTRTSTICRRCVDTLIRINRLMLLYARSHRSVYDRRGGL